MEEVLTRLQSQCDALDAALPSLAATASAAKYKAQLEQLRKTVNEAAAALPLYREQLARTMIELYKERAINVDAQQQPLRVSTYTMGDVRKMREPPPAKKAKKAKRPNLDAPSAK